MDSKNSVDVFMFQRISQFEEEKNKINVLELDNVSEFMKYAERHYLLGFRDAIAFMTL